MKYAKMLGLLAVAAAALMAFAGTASATQLTSPAGTLYTGEIAAESSSTSLHGPFTTVTCTHSTVSGEVESHGSSVTAKGTIKVLKFEKCNFPVKVLKNGTLELHATVGGNGTLTSSGAEVTIETSIANCIFTTSNTRLGTVTGGSPAKLDIESAGIPRTGHSIFCGSTGTWTGSYEVTKPNTLLID